jgi:acetamidase/formamidase
MKVQTIHATRHHFGWDNANPPVLAAAPGEEIEFEIVDASGGQLGPSSGPEDVGRLDFARVNPVTGPVRIDGARPGDALVVEVVEAAPSGWGWTAIVPGFGLLAEDFPAPALHISRYSAAGVEWTPGIRLPYNPFPGTIGVAPAAPGLHSILPPREVGGNMDIRDLTPGARLWLPVAVEGALFSVGDTHAVQGDGEVCGTAVESPMTLRLRFDLVKEAQLRRPQFSPGRRSQPVDQRYHATTGIAPDLMQAAKDAVRDMIDYLGRTYGLPPDAAYMLCSVAADLHISEVVDAPNWVVSAYLPKGIFR